MWVGVQTPSMLIGTDETDASGFIQFNPGSSYYPLNVLARAPSLGFESETKQVNEGSVINLTLGDPSPPPQPSFDYRKLIIPVGAALLGVLLGG